MQYQHYPKADEDLKPGTWKGYRVPAAITILFMCPNGHIGSLADHTIGEAGIVSPSVVCPQEGCTFHQWICLGDFTETYKAIEELKTIGM